MAGSTDHEEISREIFAEVHGILKWPPPSFLPSSIDQSSPKDLRVKGGDLDLTSGWEESIMSHCQKSMRDGRYCGCHVWKRQSAWGYLGKRSTDWRLDPLHGLAHRAVHELQKHMQQLRPHQFCFGGGPWLSELQREGVFSGSPYWTTRNNFYLALLRSYHQGLCGWVHS